LSISTIRLIHVLFLLIMLGFVSEALGQVEEGDLTKKERKALKKAQRIEDRLARDRYIVLELGPTYSQLRDTRMELSRFDGPGLSVQIGYYSAYPNGSVEDFEMIGAEYAVLVPSHDESNILNGRGDINYTYLWRFRRWDQLGVTWLLGGAVTGIFNFRYNAALVNSSVNWDGVASLGVSSELQGKIGFLRGGAWQYRLTLPLASYVNRFPEFALLTQDTGHFFGPIGKLTRVLSEIGVSKSIGRASDNLIRLSYTWDYYHFNETDFFTVSSARHQLLLGVYIKL